MSILNSYAYFNAKSWNNSFIRSAEKSGFYEWNSIYSTIDFPKFRLSLLSVDFIFQSFLITKKV